MKMKRKSPASKFTCGVVPQGIRYIVDLILMNCGKMVLNHLTNWFLFLPTICF